MSGHEAANKHFTLKRMGKIKSFLKNRTRLEKLDTLYAEIRVALRAIVTKMDKETWKS
jgi:hypothetical protein